MAIAIQNDVPLAPLTTFRIGGPAKHFVEVSCEEDIREALRWAKDHEKQTLFLGGGSNVLVADWGFDGLVIRFSETPPFVNEETIRSFAGARLMTIVETASKHSLAGMERMAGIPGSVGGAVRGNAGAFGVETKDVVNSVRAVHIDTLKSKQFSQEECHFSYQMSVFKSESSWVVCEATFVLQPNGNREELEKVMKDTIAQRNARHNQSAACAGSFFMNPKVEDEKLLAEFREFTGEEARGGVIPAGWLIDRLDLRGYRIGGAMVSDDHPNYLLNAGGATADDVLMLMAYIKTKVRNTFGVQLREEVNLVGF
jgi:UDP-N-acetylmuramate dehydrogenase